MVAVGLTLLGLAVAAPPPELAVVGWIEVVWNASRDGCPEPVGNRMATDPIAWHKPLSPTPPP